jgi:uncharacterized protein DUF6600
MNLRTGQHERNTFKQIFLSTAAAGSLLLAVAAAPPAVFSWATKAEASTNISTSINFYDELAPYGKWVSYQDRSVWIPENVDDSWRPYTQGHWAYTRSYGWIWVSDEKFGWATYHYGRWGKAPDIGWYWLPGRRWAPAWVAWSYDHYDVAWAPLPPVHSDGVNDASSLGDIPDDYWQALSVSAFLADDLSSHMFRDRDKVRRVIERGKSWTVSIENNIVVNNVLTIDNIEKRTKKKVVALEEKAVDNPEAAGKADSNSVAIFMPEVKEEPDARPKKIAKIEDVVKERESKAITKQEQPEQAATTIDQPVTKPKKDKATGAVVPQDEQQNADQPDIEKIVEAPANEQTAPPINKKKKKAEEPANTVQKGQPECDPAVTDCPPAQTLSNLEHQSAESVTAETNLPDAGAQSWKANCSPQVGGWDDGSDTYLSSAGKRVSCAMFPLKKIASAALPRKITAKAELRRPTGRFEDLLEGKKLTVVGAHLDEDDTNSDGENKGGKSQNSNSGKGSSRAGEEKTSESEEN